MTAIEPQQDGTNPRKKLYSALVGNANPEAKSHFKKFSFEQFNKRLDDEKFVEDLYQSLRDNDVVLDPKNRQPEQNYYDFIDAYVKVPTAKPAAPVAKPAVAPVAEKEKSFETGGKNYAFVGQPQTGEMDVMVVDGKSIGVPQGMTMVPEGEEIPEMEYEGKMLPEVTATPAPYQFPEPGTLAYEKISRSNPPIGSPEYDFKISMLNQPPKLALGPGGYTQDMAASLPETMEKAKQSSLSPVFKDYEVAQKMMKGEVPLVTQKDVREAKEGFGRATKEQQQAAIMGGPGYEYEQEKRAKERGKGEATSDLAKSLGALSESIGENIFNATKQVALGFSNIGVTPMGEDEPEAFYYKRERARRNEDMYRDAKATQDEFQKELAKLNIQTSVYNAIQKGQWNRVPEATAYTIGEAALQMGAFFLTRGGSAYLQTLPQEYQRGVEAIAKETNRTPEQVIADGDDAELTAMLSSGIQYGFEKFGMDQMSKGMRSKGGYKAVRDWLLKNTGNKNLARAGGLGAVAGIESLTESSQAGVSQAAELSTSQKPFMAKVDKFLTDPNFIKERKQAATAGAIGGLALGAGGRAVTKAFEKGPDITQFSPEVQGNEIIQEATRGYQDNIAKAEEQGRKPDAFNKRALNKLATDPEAWVKGEIKYLTQTIQDNKKNNIDSKVEETKLSRANALLAQIKAEKKGMEQAALVPAQEAAPVAPEAEVVPAEEVQGTGRRVVVDSLEEVPAEFRDKVIEIASGPLARFGVGKKQYAYIVPAETVTAPEVTATEAPVAETAPVTEEAPVAEEAIPVAPETEEDYSFLEETELTPEEEAALLAQEEAAPVAPAEEEVVAPQTREEIIRNNEKARQEYKKQRAEKREERLAKKQQLIDSGLSEDEATAILTKEIRDEEEAFEKSLPKVPELPKSQFQVDTEKNEADFEKMLQQTGAKKTNKAWGIAQLGDSFGYEIGDKNGAIYIKPYEEEIDTEEGRENVVTGTAIELVYVPPGQRGVGKAKKLIQQVVDAADKTGTTLKIEAVPQGEEVDVAGLKKLYESFGFVFDDIYGTRAPQAAPVEEAAPEAPAAPAPKGRKKEALVQKPKREDFPESQTNTRTPVTQKLLDYFADVFSIPKFTDDLSKGTYTKWLQNANNTGYGVALKLNAPRQAFDVIAQAEKERSEAAAPAPKAETKQEAPKPETKKEEAPKTEAKPVSTTPQEGATVEIPAQRAEFGTRKMVFKEGEWKQNVGGDILKVGPAVQQQAQEAFAGKEETKPAETKREAAPKEEGKKPSTKELASQVEDMRSLPPAKRKAAQQALEERYGKEDVEKMIEITANFTKIIDDLEQRGVVKIDCP